MSEYVQIQPEETPVNSMIEQETERPARSDAEGVLSVREFLRLPQDSRSLIDVRGESSTGYGMIPGGTNIPGEELLARVREGGAAIFHGKKPVLYCENGFYSAIVAEKLRALGAEDAVSLEGGYNGWVLASMQEEEISAEDVEKSIRKRFRKELMTPFVRAINDYDMIREGDKIAVCISGGKDSMLMAKLFQELKRRNKVQFELAFIVMDPGYNEANRRVIETNARMLGIPVQIFDSQIFDAVFTIEKNPCYLCARMRRGYLYAKAKELGCNKIALGHHYDDVIETILMGMLYGGQVQTMMPKLHSTNFEGMELIRPMYLIREDEVRRWRDYNHLHFIQCACRFTEANAVDHSDGTGASKRQEIKRLIADMKKTNPFVENNIFKSVENVNLKTIIAYKTGGVRHHFLESYDENDETDVSQ